MQVFKNTLLLIIFYFSCIKSANAAWYNNSWQFRKPITVQSSQVVADQTDFPVYLNLALLAGDNFFTNVRADGADIRITRADGFTELPFELVNLNTVANTGELHFKVSGNLSSTANTTFYIYYGNSTGVAYSENALYGAQNVWTANYQAVYHFSSNPTSTFFDSTANNNDGATVGGMTLANRVAGKLGDAFNFDGVNDYINFGNKVNITSNKLHLSAWTYPEDTRSSAMILNKENSYEIAFSSTRFQAAVETNASGAWAWGGNLIRNLNNWEFVNFTHDNTIWRLYLDNDRSENITPASNQTGNVRSAVSDLRIAARTSGSAFFKGTIDELRISSIDRSASWVRTEYNMQNSNSSFWSIGVFEARTGPQIISFIPPDNGRALNVTNNLEIFFNAVPNLQNGNITIKNSLNDSVYLNLDTNASLLFNIVGNSLKISLPTPLFYNTNYYVEIDSNSIKDFPGFTTNGVWNFNSGDMPYDINFFNRL